MLDPKHKLRSPIKLQGGKGVLRNKVIQHFPAHRVYCEPFGGGASVLFGKAPSEVEVYNDLDPRPVSVFKVLKDPVLHLALQRWLWLTPYSRETREFCRTSWNQDEDLLVQAYKFMVNSRQSFGGLLDRTSWGFVTNSTCQGKAQPVNSWQEAIRKLPRVHQRLQNVLIKNQDWRVILDDYDAPDTLFYLDPPYVQDTRRDGWFKFEMQNRDHTDLVERIVRLKGKVVLSGYRHEVYSVLQDQHGWRLIERQRSCLSVARTKKTGLQGSGVIKEQQSRVECLWLNPAVQRSHVEASHCA
jgi:DNA adenine methylase